MKATPSYLNSAILPPLGRARRLCTPFVTNTDAACRAVRIEVMTYSAPCSTAPSGGAIEPADVAFGLRDLDDEVYLATNTRDETIDQGKSGGLDVLVSEACAL